MISSSPGHWAILRGVACATLGGCLSDNPYICSRTAPPDTRRLARCWRYGFKGPQRRNISHGAMAPGWSEDQVQMLVLCWSAGDDMIADLTGKSNGAVRTKRTRMRRIGAVPAEAA